MSSNKRTKVTSAKALLTLPGWGSLLILAALSNAAGAEEGIPCNPLGNGQFDNECRVCCVHRDFTCSQIYPGLCSTGSRKGFSCANNPEGGSTCTLDATKPFCKVTISNDRRTATIEIRDAGVGITKVEAVKPPTTDNVTVTIPPFCKGEQFLVATATKTGSAEERAQVQLKVIDCNGNEHACDPITADVFRLKGKPQQQIYSELPYEENHITILNGLPGLRNVKIEVNGNKFNLTMKDSERVELDVSPAMRPGSSNTISITAYGRPGANATVFIWEGND